MNHLLSGLLTLAHFGLVIGALLWLRRYYQRRQGLRHPGIVARGTVVALETDGLRWLDEYPLVRFPGPRGEWLTLRCTEKCRAGRYRKGQPVTVRYPAPAPSTSSSSTASTGCYSNGSCGGSLFHFILSKYYKSFIKLV